MCKKLQRLEEYFLQHDKAIKLTKAFLYHIPASVVMLDFDLKLKIWSRKFAEEFFPEDENFEPDGVSFKEINSYLYEAIREKDKVNLSFKGQSFKDQVGVNGHSRLFSYEMAPWVEDGQIVGVVIVFDNITKLSERLSRVAHEKFMLVSSLSNDAVWLIDQYSNTVMVNDVLVNMLETTKENMLGKSMFEFCNPTWAKQAAKNVEKRKNGVAEVHDFMLQSSSGNDIFVEINTAPLNDEDGNYAGALAVIKKKDYEMN